MVHFTPVNELTVAHSVSYLVGFRAGMEAVEKRNFPAEVGRINNGIRSNLKSDSSFQNMSPVTDKGS